MNLITSETMNSFILNAYFSLLSIPVKFCNKATKLQDDVTGSMEIRSNPVAITFNIEIQIDITFKYYK